MLFNIFLERIMKDALDDYHTSISIGGRPVCNLRFADDIDLLAGTEAELQELTDRLDKCASQYGMEISTEKSQILVNSNSERHTNIMVGTEKLEEVTSFKHLGVALSKDGTSTNEIRKRIAMATSTMTQLTKIWKSSMCLTVKVKLYKSLVLSILLYGCEAWTLTAETQRRIRAFESKCYRRMLRVSYTEHRTNDDILE